MTIIEIEGLATPLGKLQIRRTDEGRLLALDWLDNQERVQVLLDRRLGRGRWQSRCAEAVSPLGTALRHYFAGELDALSAAAQSEGLRVALPGSPLQQQVWAALCDIPAGRTCSYAELAERIGRAGSARAVGAAVGANPLLLVLPCHRVVGAKGALTGYAAGLERKRWLLEHEGLLPRLASGASGRAMRVAT